MRRAVLILILCTAAMPSRADYTPTNISWRGWQISSSEDLETEYKRIRYPLTNLVDGRPNTAWVYSGKGRPESLKHVWGSRYALEIAPDEPVFADRLLLMNGYNKSPEIFLRNSRVIKVRISIDDQIIKATVLSDKMGWHSISLPKRPISQLKLELIGFRRGPVNDICISEIALEKDGRRLNMIAPQVVIYSEGSECGCGSNGVALTRAGAVLAHDSLEEGGSAVWSPDGRYVASAEYRGKKYRIWVADSFKGGVRFLQTAPQIHDLRWINSTRLQVEMPGRRPHRFNIALN